MEGPVLAISQSEFWEQREYYLAENYPESEINYTDDVVFEFEKLNDLHDGDEVNFWFEHDLFCQVNFWFTLSLLPDKSLTLSRVSPIVQKQENLWNGFGPMSSGELLNCFSKRSQLSEDDVMLGRNLWTAYSTADWQTLAKLSATISFSFPYLVEVCKAQLDRIPQGNQLGRPEQVLKEIIENGHKSFDHAFAEFSEREGIYGFGDSQVRRIYDKLIK